MYITTHVLLTILTFSTTLNEKFYQKFDVTENKLKNVIFVKVPGVIKTHTDKLLISHLSNFSNKE